MTLHAPGAGATATRPTYGRGTYAPPAYTPWPADADATRQSGPRFFGLASRPLFGWYHAPAGRPRGEGVVLCPAIGPEYMTGHRALRTLAERLSADGFAVLRFDWPGTGDSAGDAGDAACPTAALDEWRAALAHAVARLRAWSDGTRVTVVGLRGGASLAADVSPALDVARIVLWWPAASGRQALRELRARHVMADYEHDRFAAPEGSAPLAEGSVESDGFVLAPRLAREFGTLTFAAAPDGVGPAAREALVVAPDQGADGPAAAALVARGMRVDTQRVPGHESMRQTPLWAALPTVAIEAIATWLRERADASSAFARDMPTRDVPTREVPAAGELTGVTGATFDGVREECVRFGEDARVAGVLTGPATPAGAGAWSGGTRDSAGRPRPPVLLLHTGADHHVGPNRLWTVWARRWAQAGITTLRFDPAGIGDTPALPGNEAAAPAPYADGRTAEVAAAAAYLCERTGADHVVLIGLCSGAYYAVRAAAAGVPAARVIAVNPQFYAEHEALARSAVEGHRAPALLGKAARDPQRWGRLFRGETSARRVASMVVGGAGHVVLAATAAAAQEARALVSARRAPADGPLADLWRVSAADVPLTLVFSQEDEGWAYLRVQVRAAWRAYQRRSRVRLRVLDGTQHTFVRAWMQHQLHTVITSELLGG